jgi:hypothetical protein
MRNIQEGIKPRLGIKKPAQKNSPKKPSKKTPKKSPQKTPQRNHLKKPTGKCFFVSLKRLLCFVKKSAAFSIKRPLNHKRSHKWLYFKNKISKINFK